MTQIKHTPTRRPLGTTSERGAYLSFRSVKSDAQGIVPILSRLASMERGMFEEQRIQRGSCNYSREQLQEGCSMSIR